uniref:Uncharacterized protein n=1 Tax=Arundo donax TaxID=35708 RepID=A0A0A9FNG0_ARUDO
MQAFRVANTEIGILTLWLEIFHLVDNIF